MSHDRSSEKHTRNLEKRSNGSAHGGDPESVMTRAEDLARRAVDFVSDFPKNLKEQAKERPYRTLGIATAFGVGAGLIMGSRLLRAAAASALSVAVAELARGYLRGMVGKEWKNTFGAEKESDVKVS